MSKIITQSKVCSKCHIEKPLCEFSKDKSRKDGSQSKCKNCDNECKKQYRIDNKEYLTEYYKEYYKKVNKDPINARRRERYNNDINYKLAVLARSRLNKVIKNGYKSGSAVRDLGCTIEELKAHIEGQFIEGMTWEVWGVHGWHIDHIRPLSSFDLTDREQFLEAVHYTNLQPLWAEDNLRKHNNV